MDKWKHISCSAVHYILKVGAWRRGPKGLFSYSIRGTNSLYATKKRYSKPDAC